MRILPAIAVLALPLLAGCGVHYVTPGAAADFRRLGITANPDGAAADPAIAARLARRPAAAFPATIAAIRIQGTNYRSMSGWGYGEGHTTVVTSRDVEKQEDFERIAAMPMVRAVVPVNRLVVSRSIRSEQDLREAAASVHADLTLLYTFDTRFTTETTIPALGVLTLGLFPNQEARVNSTASAALLDTRTGYIYAIAEASDEEKQIANSWTSEDAVDQSRRRAERNAFESLLTELERSWKQVADRHAAAPQFWSNPAPRIILQPPHVPAPDPSAPPGVPYWTRP